MAGLNQIVRSYEPKSGLPSGEAYDPAVNQYPKHIYPNGPKMPYVKVTSADEEARVMGSGKEIDPDEEKKRLVAVADSHGFAVDGRWKIEKLRAAISNAGYDPDEKP